jgi:hypothetical protein
LKEMNSDFAQIYFTSVIVDRKKSLKIPKR